MARKPRNIVAGYPFRVVVRGNNGEPIFVDDDDRSDYKSVLQAACADHGLAVHGYVLLPGQVQLVGTPLQPEAVAQVMQAVGRRYVRQFNRRHVRSGTLWEGRYRASIIQPDRYLLASLRLLELEPLRAGLVNAPVAYPWSSHRHHLGLTADPLVSPHNAYWSLGNTPFDREASYRRLFEAALTVDEGRLAERWARGQALAEPAFLERLEIDTGRPWRIRPVGRPRRKHS